MIHILGSFPAAGQFRKDPAADAAGEFLLPAPEPFLRLAIGLSLPLALQDASTRPTTSTSTDDCPFSETHCLNCERRTIGIAANPKSFSLNRASSHPEAS